MEGITAPPVSKKYSESIQSTLQPAQASAIYLRFWIAKEYLKDLHLKLVALLWDMRLLVGLRKAR